MQLYPPSETKWVETFKKRSDKSEAFSLHFSTFFMKISYLFMICAHLGCMTFDYKYENNNDDYTIVILSMYSFELISKLSIISG